MFYVPNIIGWLVAGGAIGFIFGEITSRDRVLQIGMGMSSAFLAGLGSSLFGLALDSLNWPSILIAGAGALIFVLIANWAMGKA